MRGKGFGASFCNVAEGTMQFCAGGGYFFGRSARGFGASFCNLLEGSVRQWRRPCKEQVRPSGKCSFALTEATFLDAWQARPSGTCSFALAEATFLDACQMDLKLVFVSSEGSARQWRRPSKHQVRPSGTCSLALAEASTRSVLQGHAVLRWRRLLFWTLVRWI